MNPKWQVMIRSGKNERLVRQIRKKAVLDAQNGQWYPQPEKANAYQVKSRNYFTRIYQIELSPNAMIDVRIKEVFRQAYRMVLGIGTYVPGYSHLPVLSRAAPKNTGGTESSRYCYSVWLRHLSLAHGNGLPSNPHTVAELGPGDSLGIGLAALLSGASHYYAFDIVNYTNTLRNVKILEELVELFDRRESIPGESEFPLVEPKLVSYDFPAHILTNERLRVTLEGRRVESIKQALTNLDKRTASDIRISYAAPWDNSAVLKENSVDMIYSQAVLEHIDNLGHAYQMLYRWLNSGGFMSHEIDFKSHGLAGEWNGHWTFSDFVWGMIKGNRPWLLNRQPHSVHVDLIAQTNFKLISDFRTTNTSGVKRRQLSRRFKNMTDEDLVTSSVFIQATK